ncbi:myocardin isoform X2 [Rhinatrema bivittatum]|uniref:myocardin isoform X2 n=1 Tax=Rhinatrema bivittatum TaxID=194408 RepID=UPI00112D7115|nr:myocardin isoform X2 [Rhinatrema bivittatum]
MTLLGSEHSLLIRSKFRSVLQLRLQQRRTREQLVDQGIMAPLKSPGAFHEQRKSLEKDKTEDYLKHKMRNRPERSDLVNLHVLQDSAAEGSIQTAQMKLKRARLADDLNEKIAVRPGPLELVEKNIIPVDSAMKEAMKGNHVSLSKSADAFTFEEDSSNDELSPEHPKHEESQDTAATSPPQTKIAENQDSDKEVNESESALNNQNLKEMNGHLSAPIPVPAAIKSKSSGDSKNRHKKPKDTKPKVKKLKYHQYIPPDQKAEKSPPPMDSAYARLLQQQQLFLQLQILSQQQQQQQHFNYPGIHPTQLKQPSNPAVRNSNSSSSMVSSSPSLSPEKTTFSGQASVASLKPDPLPSNLDDLKVSELRQQLRIRGLPVSGTKTALMERLRPFQDCSSNAVPAFSEITTVTFPVTPSNSLSSYQSPSSSSVLSNNFYQFGSTSSTPPISPASSDLSVSGSLPDTFSDGQMSSPHFGLQPSPTYLSAEDSLMGSMNGGSFQSELESIDAEKDKMLVEKQKVINELTWKLQQEQRQVEELKMQLQKQKRTSGPEGKHLTSQPFFGVSIKQENAVSSCPFASKQIPMKPANNSSTEKINSCGTSQVSQRVNSHCTESTGQNSIISSTFLSPQCSPQPSPLGIANSPQHISLPPSPNHSYLLAVSQGSPGEERSISPHTSSRLCTAQSTVVPSGSPGCFSSNQPSRQAPFLSNNAESKQSHRDAPSPHSPNIQQQMAGSQSSSQTGPKFSISSSSFCNSSSAHSKIKQPPSYEDAMKQQISRSQQMDELLDVLIESGEMPANAKEEHSCPPKVPHITVSVSSASVSGAFDHCPSSNDNHLEVLLNSQNLLGRTSDATLLKIGGDASHFEGVMDGFSAKAPEELLTSREILDSALPPVETRLCSPSLEGSALPHLSFTESPWETMEWLDLTPPSSATGFGSLTSTGPSIFNTDFLDVTDLNLNTAMDLHLEQW